MAKKKKSVEILERRFFKWKKQQACVCVERPGLRETDDVEATWKDCWSEDT